VLSHFFGRAGAGKREERRPAALWFKIVSFEPSDRQDGRLSGGGVRRFKPADGLWSGP
jgi:hypothetical protein